MEDHLFLTKILKVLQFYIKEVIYPEPLITIFLLTDYYIALFYVCFYLKTPIFKGTCFLCKTYHSPLVIKTLDSTSALYIGAILNSEITKQNRKLHKE